jgi:hypothetical protein
VPRSAVAKHDNQEHCATQDSQGKGHCTRDLKFGRFNQFQTIYDARLTPVSTMQTNVPIWSGKAELLKGDFSARQTAHSKSFCRL